ncbi:MAG TPA: LCP family protein [Arthrobacter sp.]|nr:LCP family protein [Arthrobacter sp.]
MGSRRNRGHDDTHDPYGHPDWAAGIHHGAGRHLRSKRGGPLWLKISAMVVACAVVGVVAFAGIQLWRLQSNLTTAPLNLGTEDSTQLPVDPKTDPLQILIIGTDTRTGNSGYGSTELAKGYGHADVMMLMQLSADRERVTVVSFPRDLMVPLPACEDPQSGSVSPELALGQLNSSLSFGGPGCTVAAINDMTGLTIDHFMMADFNAVKELSKTLGGVKVCLNRPVHDDKSNLNLPAGVSTVEGEQALAFLRTRHGFGNGSDLDRIRAQQSFLSSMVRKVKDNGTLSNLPRLYSIAETVTRNLTVDEGLSKIPKLVSTATRLSEVDLSEVAFVTVPNEPWPQNPARLQLTQPAAGELFATLRADGDVTQDDDGKDGSANASAAGTPSAATSAPPTAADETTGTPLYNPATIPVQVINASGIEGRSAGILRKLHSEGYTLATKGPDAVELPGTQLFFGGVISEQMALQVAAELGIPDSQVVPSASVAGVKLSIGEDFAEGVKLSEGNNLTGLEGQTADQVTCQG